MEESALCDGDDVNRIEFEKGEISKNEFKRRLKRKRCDERKKDQEDSKASTRNRIDDSLGIASTDNLSDRRIRKADERLLLEEKCSETFPICIDCDYEQHMSDNDIKSLCKQLMTCYSENKKANIAHRIFVCGVGSRLQAKIDCYQGMQNWIGTTFTETRPSDYFDCSRLTYLSADSPNVLSSQLPSRNQVFVIGGLVDHNRVRHASLDRATSYNISTAKFPLSEALGFGVNSLLTVNQVFEMLVKMQWTQNDDIGAWRDVFMSVLPRRKIVNKETSSNAQKEEKDEELC